MSADKSDRAAVNREYKGAQSGNQAENVTGKPVKTQEKPSTLDGQVKHIVVDAEKWATDAGGRSTAFGKGGPGDKRGTSGSSDVHVDEK